MKKEEVAKKMTSGDKLIGVAKHLKGMVKQPASKEWFAKHGKTSFDPRQEAAKHLDKLVKKTSKAAKSIKLNDRGLPF